jgi:S1-C subfamily serine protease
MNDESDRTSFSSFNTEPLAGRPVEPRPEPKPVTRWRRGLAALALTGALLASATGGGVIGALAARSFAPAPVALATPAPPVALVAPTVTPPAASATQPAPVAPAPPAVQGQPVAVQAAATNIVVDVYNRVSPAVVSISSRVQGRGGIGSGFIIDQQGHILTNNHVVQGASSLLVTLADGTNVPARVVGTAPGNDLALIKIDPPQQGLTVARLGDSDAVVPGEVAIAIGSPSGLEQTVTAGIVSSVGRTFGGSPSSRPLRGLIQTDAAINPGNSGGPLLNSAGEVIGINTLKAPDTQGIGFAVPINTAKRLLPQLQAGGRVSSPYLGISGRAITAQVAQALNLPVTEGVLIVSVVDGGPAATAGIRGGAPGQGENAGAGGDIITAIDGQPVRRVEDIGAVLDTKRAGDSVEVSILREGQPRKITVVLGEWPTS